ncbi:hypothetical protein RCS94_06895 [Orbaceae bacterium ac157xtp]
MIAQSSYGVMSATSANTIQGRAPAFTGQSGANKLGFVVDGTAYSQELGNINSNTIKEFNAGLKLSDFHVKTLGLGDFNVSTDYYDADGDEAHSTMPFSIGSMAMEWYERGGTSPIADTRKTLGCGSNLSLPLTLKVKLYDVRVYSKYGDPKISYPTLLEKEYKIDAGTGICFAQPNSTDWYYYDGPSRHPVFGGGYSDDFDPFNGFKASATTKFPTTGFPKAKFRLVMTSSASNWTFTKIANPSNSVTIDVNGNVTLNSKPIGAVTIKATLKSSSTTVYSYTFNPTTVWVIPKGSTTYDYNQAKNLCGGEANIPFAGQLTNSPQIFAEDYPSLERSYYTRAIDGSIFGEWGSANDLKNTSPKTYPGSKWLDAFYWTKNYFSRTEQLVIDSLNGRVTWTYPHYDMNVACLG